MKIKIAITIGDAAGIGPEIAIKAAIAPSLQAICDMILIGPEELIRSAASHYAPGFDVHKISKKNNEDTSIYFDDFGGISFNGDINAATSTAAAGKAAYQGVEGAVLAVIDNKYDAIVTAPVSKESVNMAGIEVQGHTELVAALCGVDEFCMMQSDKDLRVVFASCHIPLMDVRDQLSKDKIVRTIKLLEEACRADGVKNPLIAIAGLNPHAGEGGFMGKEEIDMIIPAMKEVANDGIRLEGPFPADTLFIESIRNRFDGIVAMYHDQGHIPFKMLAFDRGVNSTLGLPIIRTSVDHGTAFNIAWQGKADTGSLFQAIRVAVKRAKLKKN
jgi:4-phospho-D-threonate 3-dehydrogenase / 4-phospho-D-erythronate 3-dehydrogenase